jgi:predicted secreted Zn-dependent protease
MTTSPAGRHSNKYLQLPADDCKTLEGKLAKTEKEVASQHRVRELAFISY